MPYFVIDGLGNLTGRQLTALAAGIRVTVRSQPAFPIPPEEFDFKFPIDNLGESRRVLIIVHGLYKMPGRDQAALKQMRVAVCAAVCAFLWLERIPIQSVEFIPPILLDPSDAVEMAVNSHIAPI